MLASLAAVPASTYVPLPLASMRAKPLWVVPSGAGAVPTTRKPKKTFPLLSAVSGVLMKMLALKAAAFAW